LITCLAEITGSVVSAKRISDYLKSQNLNMSHRLVLEYLFYLESVFLVDRVKRKDVVGKKVFWQYLTTIKKWWSVWMKQLEASTKG
jgi:uncharacterized protein